MTRIATRNVRTDRPESLGRPAQPSAEQVSAAVERHLSQKAAHGYGPPAGVPEDAHPNPIGPHDAAILQREADRRARDLADLPDTGQPMVVNSCDGNHMWGKCDRDECDFEEWLAEPATCS